MQYLDSEIEKINLVLKQGLTNEFFCDSITRITERNSFDTPEKVNADKDTNAVIFDDSYDYYVYHRLVSINGSQELKSPGKTRKFLNNATIEMYVYTKDRNYVDCIQERITSIKNLQFNSIDFDSYNYIQNETSKKDFNPADYIYVVNYNLQYKTTCSTLDACI